MFLRCRGSVKLVNRMLLNHPRPVTIAPGTFHLESPSLVLSVRRISMNLFAANLHVCGSSFLTSGGQSEGDKERCAVILFVGILMD